MNGYTDSIEKIKKFFESSKGEFNNGKASTQ